MKVLYYDGGDADKRSRVQNVLEKLSYPYTMIEQMQGNVRLVELVNDHVDPHTPPACLPQFDLMIFADADDEQIIAVSSALAAQDAQVDCKCVITKYNREWALKDLLSEVMSERAYFQSRAECQALIQAVANVHESDYTPASWKAYEAAFMHGALLFQEEQADKAQFDAAIALIEQAKANLIKKS